MTFQADQQCFKANVDVDELSLPSNHPIKKHKDILDRAHSRLETVTVQADFLNELMESGLESPELEVLIQKFGEQELLVVALVGDLEKGFSRHLEKGSAVNPETLDRYLKIASNRLGIVENYIPKGPEEILQMLDDTQFQRSVQPRSVEEIAASIRDEKKGYWKESMNGSGMRIIRSSSSGFLKSIAGVVGMMAAIRGSEQHEFAARFLQLSAKAVAPPDPSLVETVVKLSGEMSVMFVPGAGVMKLPNASLLAKKVGGTVLTSLTVASTMAGEAYINALASGQSVDSALDQSREVFLESAYTDGAVEAAMFFVGLKHVIALGTPVVAISSDSIEAQTFK